MGRELGRLVTDQREARSWSRRDLSERAGISYPYLSQIETGEREPSLSKLRSLAEALEVPVEELAARADTELWLTGSAPVQASEPPSPSRGVGSYRDKVLPSVERKLRMVPPLERLQLLAELQQQALQELAGGE